MLKLKLLWELETGEKFEEWTRPIELSLAEKELYSGKSIVKILIEESTPSNTLLLFLAHKIQQRVKAPSFSIGGNRKVGSSAFSAGYVIMGNEFGSKQYKQFPRRSGKGGKEGWWLYRAMSRFQPTIAREWLAGYEKIRDAWKAGL
jgi:hypothetical protein